MESELPGIQTILNAEANKVAEHGNFGVPHHIWSDAPPNLYGPHTFNYGLLLKQ